jgi:hypothetical protein
MRACGVGRRAPRRGGRGGGARGPGAARRNGAGPGVVAGSKEGTAGLAWLATYLKGPRGGRPRRTVGKRAGHLSTSPRAARAPRPGVARRGRGARASGASGVGGGGGGGGARAGRAAAAPRAGARGPTYWGRWNEMGAGGAEGPARGNGWRRLPKLSGGGVWWGGGGSGRLCAFSGVWLLCSSAGAATQGGGGRGGVRARAAGASGVRSARGRAARQGARARKQLWRARAVHMPRARQRRGRGAAAITPAPLLARGGCTGFCPRAGCRASERAGRRNGRRGGPRGAARGRGVPVAASQGGKGMGQSTGWNPTGQRRTQGRGAQRASCAPAGAPSASAGGCSRAARAARRPPAPRADGRGAGRWGGAQVHWRGRGVWVPHDAPAARAARAGVGEGQWWRGGGWPQRTAAAPLCI